jgi:hypothetical protein
MIRILALAGILPSTQPRDGGQFPGVSRATRRTPNA